MTSLHSAGVKDAAGGGEPPRLIVPLRTADVPGGAKALTRVGWAHVELVARCVFPWWNGPGSDRTRIQRALMRWLSFMDFLEREQLAIKMAKSREALALSESGGARSPTSPPRDVKVSGTPFRDDKANFPRLRLAATPRARDAGHLQADARRRDDAARRGARLCPGHHTCHPPSPKGKGSAR